jgi:hypothetical protein
VGGTYQARISRRTPACVVILLDQSGSMEEPIGGADGVSKAVAAAEAVNRQLRTLARKSSKVAGEGVRPYFDIAVLGYGGDVTSGGVTYCLPGTARGKELVSITTLAASPLRVDPVTRLQPDGKGGQVATTGKMPVWFDPVARGGTPMLEAIRRAHETIGTWAAGHEDSYPPIVINITDGEPYEDPSAAAKALDQISTNDGSALLYNIHLSGAAATEIEFPADPSVLPDQFARLLFGMSSALPEKARQDLAAKGHQTAPQARGFIFNANPTLMVTFLEAGTNVSEARGGRDR